MSRVVIVLPTKDRRALLERAIESVRAQEGDWRAVVVDDGSHDGTREYLTRLAQADGRFTVLHNEPNRGVNVSRNRALSELGAGEWGFLLDDDDMLLPGAVSMMLARIAHLPLHVKYVFFNTHIKTEREVFVGGYQFGDSNTEYYDPTYLDVITKKGLRGDCKPAIEASLIGKGYRFAEDVNGFESEFNALVARDGVGIRFYRDQVVRIDQRHGGERLSESAAQRNPDSFVRVHLRMLRAHRELLQQYPSVLQARAVQAFKISIRAHDVRGAALFVGYWMRGFLLSVFSTFLRKRDEKE